MTTDYLVADTVTPVRLKQLGNRPEQVHLFDQDSIDAINAALAAQRPLLIRGEPGVGKSQLARAAAAKLGRAFLHHVVDAHCESRDLLWRFDAVQRLAEAQLAKELYSDKQQIEEALRVDKFVRPGPLWWAFNWISAKRAAGGKRAYPQFDGGNPGKGCVLLIDEIDKAEMDVPNGLLEALGDAQFTPMGCDQPVVASGVAPLVIITTNEERALPDAFIRRCLVLHLKLEKQDDKLIEQLCRRGRAHFASNRVSDAILKEAAGLLIEDRKAAKAAQRRPLPGQAEYLDLLRAVCGRPGATDDATQTALLKKLRRFVVNKHDGAA